MKRDKFRNCKCLWYRIKELFIRNVSTAINPLNQAKCYVESLVFSLPKMITYDIHVNELNNWNVLLSNFHAISVPGNFGYKSLKNKELKRRVIATSQSNLPLHAASFLGRQMSCNAEKQAIMKVIYRPLSHRGIVWKTD